MAHGTITDEELADLVRRTEEATAAFICGDMRRYLELTPHAPGFTLMNPFGGPPTRYDNRAESLEKVAGYFAGGEAKLELVQAHASGDIVVLVMIERQHGKVGGLPDQNWSLRVTRSIAVTTPNGGWCIGMPIRSSRTSAWKPQPRSPAAKADPSRGNATIHNPRSHTSSLLGAHRSADRDRGWRSARPGRFRAYGDGGA
jgi:hypothetical protein